LGALALLVCAGVSAADLPLPRYHLTSHPWSPLATKPSAFLDAIEGVCRFSIKYQDKSGAIIDPFLHREHQYATPYFAYAVGVLVQAGRARDLLPNGIRAMDHATECVSKGRDAIPDQHGEFFLANLTEGLEVYKDLVSKDQLDIFRNRLKLPIARIIKGSQNNWQTYAMKGEWLRFKEGLVPRETALAFIENAWRTNHRSRIAPPPFLLYHDRSSDPDTLSVEAVGRGNLLALIANGYDGPSAGEVTGAVEAATRATLLLQDPSGQVPANGRTDDHVWVDIGYQLEYEVMAERSLARGDKELAGQFRRAANLAFQSALRWRRSEGEWAGSFSVTKNFFDPALRVGYQDASQYSNYNGSLMFHLAEAYQNAQRKIDEKPTPSEIGGYAFQLDREYATVFANAGGMQMQANLRGQVGESSGNYWTPLGAVRFSRARWETRLGPSDGALTANDGASFAPAFIENGRWVKLSGATSRYRASWSTTFVHPALVRCALEYRPVAGQTGPSFRNEFVITPDGILSTLTKLSPEPGRWGTVWPLLVNDGRPLLPEVTARQATISYARNSDVQIFLALDPSASLLRSEPSVRSTYGDLRPIIYSGTDAASRTFIYPRNNDQPSADEVLKSFHLTGDGFQSTLGRVEGNVYIGRTIAGGIAHELSLSTKGAKDVRFSRECGFLLQLSNGKLVGIEVDRPVHATIQGKEYDLDPYKPRKT
jgi:hypothetical protein